MWKFRQKCHESINLLWTSFLLSTLLLLVLTAPSLAWAEGYWRLADLNFEEHEYISQRPYISGVYSAGFIDPEPNETLVLGEVPNLVYFTVLEREPSNMLGLAEIEGVVAEGATGDLGLSLYKGMFKFSAPPAHLIPGQKFSMSFSGSQLFNTTSLYSGISLWSYEKIYKPGDLSTGYFTEVGYAHLELYAGPTAGDKTYGQVTAQVMPRNQDVGRNDGYIYRVMVKTGEAYRIYDYVYDWIPGPLPTQKEIRVFIDYELLTVEVPPVIQNGRTMLPLRAILEALGAEVGWDPITQTVTATKGDTVVTMVLGSSTAYVNNIPFKLDAPPYTVKGRTLVPARFLAESFKAGVAWDGTAWTVHITTK